MTDSQLIDPLASLMSVSDIAGLTSGEVQTEEGHKVDISKLKIICDMVLSGYSCIDSIFLTPGTLFMTRLEDLIELTFDVVMTEFGSDWSEDGGSLIEYFMKDEYPEFKGKVNIVPRIGLSYGEYPSYILMSTRRKVSVYGMIDWNDMNILNTMLTNGIPVAIPYTWNTLGRKCILALVEQVQDVYSLRSHMMGSMSMYGINVSAGVTDLYNGEWHYITAIGNKTVPYGLPYELLDRNILEQQIKAISMKD